MSLMKRFSMTGKTAIVTGSGQGIGKATAIALAEAGASVVLAGINISDPADSESQLRGVAQELTELGAETAYIVTDVRKEADLEAMLAKALKTFGKVDILVNNAGGGATAAPVLELTTQIWEEVIWENLISTFLACRIVGKHMAENGSGSIVNFSSMDGRGPSPGLAHYAAAKAAICNFTETLAAELGPVGVRVNTVAPWLTRSPFVAGFLADHPDVEELAKSVSPLGRIGEPEDMASVAFFLASDASSFVSGQTIHVSGGTLPGNHMPVHRTPQDIPGLQAKE